MIFFLDSGLSCSIVICKLITHFKGNVITVYACYDKHLIGFHSWRETL